MHIPNPLYEQAAALIERCREESIALVTAESCTGGLIIAALTEIAGSSDVVIQGFVTYSNAAKIAALGVPAALIARHGAVSEEVARAMAEGALAHAAPCEGKKVMAISVTGIAGPGGGSVEKPVGTVCFGLAGSGARQTIHCLFAGDRQAIRLAAVEKAFVLLSRAVTHPRLESFGPDHEA